MSAGKKIKEIRESFKLTQRELGELCGIDPATIRKYENGKLNPKPATLEKIARGLGVDPGILIESEIDAPRAMMKLFSVYNVFGGHLKDGSDIKNEIEEGTFDDNNVYLCFDSLRAFIYSWYLMYCECRDRETFVKSMESIDNDTKKMEIDATWRKFTDWMNHYPESEPQQDMLSLHKSVDN